MRRTDTKECREALDAFKPCNPDKDVPETDRWDFLFNKADIQWKWAPELRGTPDADNAKVLVDYMHPEKGYGWEIRHSYPIESQLSEELLDIAFHELFHTLGGEHSGQGINPTILDELQYSIISYKCGFLKGLSNKGHAGRALYDRMQGLTPDPVGELYLKKYPAEVIQQTMNKVKSMYPGFFK